MGITYRVPTVGIPGAAQWKAHEAALEKLKPKKEMAA
jgi:hypothetical protein